MKRVKTIIKFDGPSLVDRSMDVADLAPALISLSDVFKAANVSFNGERSAVKVLVNADLEQNCFELVLHLAQTIWEQVESLISDDCVKSIKEIAEWIGIISGVGGGTGVSLFGLIKFLNGQKVKDTVVIQQENGEHSVQISIEGNDNSVVVSQPVYKLYTNKEIRKKAVGVLQPLKSDGYDSLQFYEGNKVFEEFKPEDVPDICDGDLPDIRPSNEQISKIRTSVRIRKPAYEGRSKWTIVYLRAVEASMEDLEWLDKFQNNKIPAPPNSSLDVDLEQTVIVNERGEALEDPTYKVLKVHDVTLPEHQEGLF